MCMVLSKWSVMTIKLESLAYIIHMHICPQAPTAPDGGSNRRYTVRYESVASGRTTTRTYHYHPLPVNLTAGEEFSYTLNFLMRDTEYRVQIGMDIGYSQCYYYYISGNYSDPIPFQTNATRMLEPVERHNHIAIS